MFVIIFILAAALFFVNFAFFRPVNASAVLNAEKMQFEMNLIVHGLRAK